MGNWRKEPWGAVQGQVYDEADDHLGNFDGEYTRAWEDDANSQRAVVCVNACAGLSDPAADLLALRAVADAARAWCAAQDDSIPDASAEELLRAALARLEQRQEGQE